MAKKKLLEELLEEFDVVWQKYFLPEIEKRAYKVMKEREEERNGKEEKVGGTD